MGLVRAGDFRNGNPITLPHTFGNAVAGDAEPFGNEEPQSNTTLDSNPVTWVVSPTHFGNPVSFSLETDSASAPVLIVPPDNAGNISINLTNLLGSNSATLTYYGAPSGVTVTFSTNPDTGMSVATVTVGAVPAGRYTITVVGTVSGMNIETTNIQLVVAGPQLPALSAPTFSPGAGTYTSTQSVTLTVDAHATATYYTTDGSTPTTGSTLYTGAISVAVSETVKAISVGTGYGNSPVGSAAYIINAPKGVALVAHTMTNGAVNSVATSGVNTTDANFLLVAVFSYSAGSRNPNLIGITDTVGGISTGNTWTNVTNSAGGSTASSSCTLFYSQAPTVGANHVVTVTFPADSGGYMYVGFAAFSGMATSSVFESEADTGASRVTLPAGAGSVSAVTIGDLIIAEASGYDGFSGNTGLPATIDTGFTIIDTQFNATVAGASGIGAAAWAYLVAPNTSGVNPNWTMAAGCPSAYMENAVFAAA